MQVEVVRRGGFAGIPLRGTVDTARLSPDEVSAAEAALQVLPFDRPPGTPRHPDSFQYEITVADGGRRRSAVVDEAELPAGLRPLVNAALSEGSPG
ncbi:MAG TPA: protealysin inhibitor emfourin [Dehalococcoidia bacterium]|jgi:hypothetical protein